MYYSRTFENHHPSPWGFCWFNKLELTALTIRIVYPLLFTLLLYARISFFNLFNLSSSTPLWSQLHYTRDLFLLKSPPYAPVDERALIGEESGTIDRHFIGRNNRREPREQKRRISIEVQFPRSLWLILLVLFFGEDLMIKVLRRGCSRGLEQ